MKVAFNLIKIKVNIKTSLAGLCMGLISWVQAGWQWKVCNPVGLSPEHPGSPQAALGRTTQAVLGGVKPPDPVQCSASPRWCRKRNLCAGGLCLSCGRCGACGVELGWKVAGFCPAQGSVQ